MIWAGTAAVTATRVRSVDLGANDELNRYQTALNRAGREEARKLLLEARQRHASGVAGRAVVPYVDARCPPGVGGGGVQTAQPWRPWRYSKNGGWKEIGPLG